MTDDEKFEVWKSRVELHLELMVKKSIYDFDYYNYRRDSTIRLHQRQQPHASLKKLTVNKIEPSNCHIIRAYKPESLDRAACDRRSASWTSFPPDSHWRSACGSSKQGCGRFPISARTGCDGIEPRAGYDPQQEDEDECEKHERIHRALLALFTNLPEHGAGNFKVMITDGALPISTRSK